jgi:hypothetical protein
MKISAIGFAARRRFATLCAAIVLVATLGACTMTKAYENTPDQDSDVKVSRVMLLPPDVELSELSAAGLLTPKADWTKRAEGHVNAAVDSLLAQRNVAIIRFQSPGEDDPAAHDFAQMEKLHEAVGQSILLHKYAQPLELPTKKSDRLNWTLGPNVGLLAQGSDADHALFVYLRDSFSSDDRKAAMIFAALLGVGIHGGLQVGFASLVDLESGEVVWFNRLFSQHGDLREAESAHSAVEHLLSKAPL